MPFFNDVTPFFQFADAITIIGISDPILSYLPALQLYFDDIPMLKEGYNQVYSKSPTFGNGKCWQADPS